VGAYSYAPLHKVTDDELTCVAFAGAATVLVGGASGRVYVVLDYLHVQTVTLPAPVRSLAMRNQVPMLMFLNAFPLLFSHDMFFLCVTMC
jgi:hypothetical protein